MPPGFTHGGDGPGRARRPPTRPSFAALPVWARAVTATALAAGLALGAAIGALPAFLRLSRRLRRVVASEESASLWGEPGLGESYWLAAESGDALDGAPAAAGCRGRGRRGRGPMRRWWVLAALLLSVGLNCGLLGAWLAPAGEGSPEPRPRGRSPPPRASLRDGRAAAPRSRASASASSSTSASSSRAPRPTGGPSRRRDGSSAGRWRGRCRTAPGSTSSCRRRRGAMRRSNGLSWITSSPRASCSPPSSEREFLAMVGRLRPPREAGGLGPTGGPGRPPRERWLRRQQEPPAGRATRPPPDPSGDRRP